MENINELYRQVIMDHYKNPRYKGLINNSKYLNIFMSNPSCGDELTIQLYLEDGIVKDLRHDGKGCSICCASASIICEKLHEVKIDQSLVIIQNFYEMVKGLKFNEELINTDELSLQGVAKFPARIKCATLAWKAVEKGLSHD
ncbi:MAG: SUF system NifU family Fe-S cluster assembly protein [Acholeplasmatales bacterium]|jgi:nitrogen fixation NifU-like protein|nr:SUF system NifU family Fe-S cluster assembly protein [Acholeplasmatales bacterium]